MTTVASTSYQKYAAPREDRSSLVLPPVDALAQQLANPPSWIAGVDADGVSGEVEFCGKPLAVVREFARRETLELAARYTAGYLDDPSLTNLDLEVDTPIVLSGHQPELFHPGVWFKNFLLSALGQRTGAVSINFLVDNDNCRNTAIRVPVRTRPGGPNGDSQTPQYTTQSLAFDEVREAMPWELRQVSNLDTWSSFPERIAQVLPPELDASLLKQMWPTAIAATQAGGSIGQAMAQARHTLEHQIGLRTLEVPLSQLATTRSFSRFCIQLLSELPRFQHVYNDQLTRYRSAHRIRNHAHPVPALEQSDGWLESPLWVYRHNAPTRQRLWVRVSDHQLMLSDRAGWQATIQGRLDCDNAATQWMDLAAEGVCLRPRALLTTMYMRLLVGDLFVHGIGGAKYDQLTDMIIQDFFGIEPPPVAVATATLQLPLVRQNQIEDETVSQHKQRIWRLKHNADAAASHPDPEFAILSARKQELLSNIPAKGQKWQWHTELAAVKQQLAAMASPEADDARQRIDAIAADNRQRRIVDSREYSFCLFPIDYIRRSLTNMLGG